MYSVVIPTYRRPKELLNCVDIVLRQTIKPKEIIVSGVESDDDLKGVLDILKERCQREGVDFKCVLSMTRGISIQRNKGLEAASLEYILMIDDDVEIPENFVQIAINLLRKKNALIVTGFDQRPFKIRIVRNALRKLFYLDSSARNLQVVLPSGSKIIAYAADDDIETEWLSTTVWVMKRSIIDHVKFDENLVTYSHREDQDFSYSVYKNFGGGLILSPSLKFYHHHAPSGRVKESKFCHLYVYNTYLLFRKHFFRSKYKALFTWSMLGMALQALNHSLQKRDLGILYETLRALGRVVRFWNLGKGYRFDELYKPLVE